MSAAEMYRPMKNYDLSDQVAVITGGAGLLGREYGDALSAAGAHVVVADILGTKAADVAAQVNKKSGVEAMSHATDVASPESVKDLINTTIDKFGRIDILVNNAALDPKFDAAHHGEHTSNFENFPFAKWQESLDVNVTGMFLCAQAVAGPMLEAKSGIIVNISSTYGLVGPDQRLYEREGEANQYKPVTYSVAKAAVLGLTRYLATYFRGSGIRVNTLTPGGVVADHDEEFMERYAEKTILNRMANPEEISSALLFLVSPASSYMTGSNLIVDGGWTAW